MTITQRTHRTHLTKQIVSDLAPGSTSEEAMNSDLVALHNLDEHVRAVAHTAGPNAGAARPES